MELRYCEWANCVWKMIGWKKYRIGNKKAIFKVKVGNPVSKNSLNRYSCEGCVRQIMGEKKDYYTLSKNIKPLTKKAEKILVLLRLE